MFSEDELLPISGLQHLAFCERQCALIHIERLWQENVLTSEGRILHEKAHEEFDDYRSGVRVCRSLPLCSLLHGLFGVADVVEYYPSSRAKEGVQLPGLSGLWDPYPVEYKRGRKKKGPYDEVQLCAQALCLEEMLQVKIPEGALFYGSTRRREIVAFDDKLRQKTVELVERFRSLLLRGITPKADYGPKCKSCSLKDLCLPQLKGSSVSRYLSSFFEEEIS